jgi:transketolase
MIKYNGPVYLRLGREKMPVIMSPDYHFEIGKAVKLKEGKDIVIIATGLMVSKALEAVEILHDRSINAGVLNVHTIKPLDEKSIIEAVKTGRLITVEEHSVIGGLGSAIDELIIRHHLNKEVQITNIGIEDQFGQTGTADQLLNAYGLTTEKLVCVAEKMIGESF